MHILKIKCRLVYTKCPLFKKHDVSSTPNTYFGKQSRRLPKTRKLISGQTMGHAVCKFASRLRRTHIVKKRRFPPSVSSTPNAHSKNQVSSRLRQMLLILKKRCLVNTKCLFWGKNRPERSRTGPGHSNLASRLHPFFLPPNSPFFVRPSNKIIQKKLTGHLLAKLYPPKHPQVHPPK